MLFYLTLTTTLGGLWEHHSQVSGLEGGAQEAWWSPDRGAGQGGAWCSQRPPQPRPRQKPCGGPPSAAHLWGGCYSGPTNSAQNVGVIRLGWRPAWLLVAECPGKHASSLSAEGEAGHTSIVWILANLWNFWWVTYRDADTNSSQATKYEVDMLGTYDQSEVGGHSGPRNKTKPLFQYLTINMGAIEFIPF